VRGLNSNIEILLPHIAELQLNLGSHFFTRTHENSCFYEKTEEKRWWRRIGGASFIGSIIVSTGKNIEPVRVLFSDPSYGGKKKS